MDIYKRLKRLYTEEEEKEQKKEEEKKDNSDIIISKEYMNSYLPALEEDRTESYAGDKIDEFVEKPEPAYNPVETVTITSRPSQTVAEKTTPSLLDKEKLTNQNTSRSFAEEKALDVTKGLNRNELTETYKIYTDKVASAIKQNNYYDFYENYIVAKEVEDMLKANNLFDVIGDGVEALAYGANTSFYTVMDGINKVINNYKYSDDNLNSSLLYKIASGTSNSVEETLNSGRNYLNNLHIQFPDDEKITMLYDYVTNGNFKGDQKEIADLVQYANLKERANANETYYNTYTKKAKDLQERSELKTDLSYDGIAKQIVKGAEGVGNMGSTIVLNTIAGGGGLTMLALSAYSNAFEEAKKDGANESQANWYAILNSASEIASELIGGENVNAVLVKPLSTTPLGEAINSFIESQGIRSKFARSVIRNIGQVGAEFTEEMATATIDPILKRISYGYQQFPNAPEEYIKSIFDSGLDSISTTLLLSGIGKAETLAVLNKNQQNYEKAIRNSPYFNQEQKATMLKELQEATNQAKEVVTKDYEKTLKDLKSKLDNRKAQYQKNIGTVLENQTLTPEERANVVIKYNDKMVEQADVGSQTTQEIIDNNEKVRTSIADDIKAEIGRILDNNQKVQGIEPTEEISKSKSNIVNLINRISGLNMVLADIKSSDGSTINGFTNKKGSTVYVNSNMNLKDTLSTALHEVGHHYRITYSDIFNKFVKKAGIEAENDLTREYREAHGMEDAPLEDVQEDMFGDYIGEILSKPKNVKSLEKSTRDIASIFQSILAGDMSNSKVSSYNLDFTSKLGGDIINDTNFEKELLNSIKKQKTFAKPVIKKSESTTSQQKGETKSTTSQKKTDSKEEKKNRETNKETPINNIVKRYNQMKEAAEDRPPAFEKMIADELGVEYNTKKSLNDPRISSIYEQLKQGIPADEIMFSQDTTTKNNIQKAKSRIREIIQEIGIGKAEGEDVKELTRLNMQEKKTNIEYVEPNSLVDSIVELGNRLKDEKSLIQNIKDSGFIEPIIISKNTGNIQDGGHRLLIAIEMGLNEVPVIYTDSASDYKPNDLNWKKQLAWEVEKNGKKQERITTPNERNQNEQVNDRGSVGTIEDTRRNAKDDRVYKEKQTLGRRPSTSPIYGSNTSVGEERSSTTKENIDYSSISNPYNKLNFTKGEVPKDDNHIRQYEYIKDRLTDVVGGFNIAPEYDIKIRKDEPKRPDLFEVELYDKKGKLKGIIRVGNKSMWRKVDSALGKPVTTLKLSDYKTVFGLASSFKSAISKTFQEAINSLPDIKKAMKENDNSIAEKIGKKREIAEEKAKQREEKMNTDQEEYIKQTKEKETKKKIEDTEKQLKSDNEAFNKAVKNLGKKIEQLQTSKEKFENAYEDLKKDSAYKLAIEKFETQFANKAKNSEYSFNSNDKANFVMLRIFGTNIENAFNEVVRMKEETFKRINSINRTIDMLKDLRRVYKKMPNDLKVRIDSYISIYTKAVDMTELTLHNKFITSEYIKEHLLGKVPLTKGIRNKILTDGKEMVSLGDLLSTTDLAEAFERGVRELYEEAVEELARNRLQEVKEDMQEQIDNIGKAVKLVAEDTAKRRENRAGAGEVKGRIAYTFKTETQALMRGDVGTSLMQIEKNLQNGETRKKIAINRFYAILNREMKDSSGLNKLIHSKKFKEDLEKTLSRNAEWLDTGIEVDGRELKLPKSMILSLAMHLKNDDNMAHISGAVVGAKVLDGEGFVMPDIVYKEGGGVVVPDEALYKKGDLSKAYSRGETVKLSKKQVESIVDMLSEEEKEFLNTVADIYKLSTKLINEVSREVLGYDLATVENYFPIHAYLMDNVHHIGTDNMTAEDMLNNYKNNFGGASIFEPGKAIRNQGQLKERTTSFAPIYLENIAEVLNRSINDTSLFYGYTQDLIKNDIILASSYEDGAKTGGTTRKTLKNMLNYIDNNYLKDYYKLVNFILGREKLNNKIRSLIAQNTLTFNIGTWLVQPMSFFNTLKYFSTKEFMKSINPLNNHVKLNDMVRQYYNDLGYDTSEKGNFELVRDFIAEATPILENRAINFRIPGVNQLFNKRMIDKLGIKGISTFDDIAVTAIARMMAYSVSLDPSIKFGSDEYFEVLGDRLNQVLLETQPERSDINRANIFRSDNPFARIFSLFGTPPNQILNNVASSSMNFRYKLEYGSEEEKQEAFNSLAKSVAGAIASSVGTAVIRATRDKVRAGDDDDVPYLDRIVGQYLVAMLSPTIIGDEIATWIMQQAKYGGISFYDISSPEVSYLTNLTTLANKLSKLPSKDVSATKKTVDIIKALGGVTGLDTRSLVHFTEAMLKFVFPDTYKAYTLLNNSNIYKRWAENKETDLSEFYVGYQVTRKKAIEAKGQKYNNESIKDALEEEGLGDLYEIFKLGKK